MFHAHAEIEMTYLLAQLAEVYSQCTDVLHFTLSGYHAFFISSLTAAKYLSYIYSRPFAGLSLDAPDGPQDMKEFKLEKATSDDEVSLCSYESSEASKEVMAGIYRILCTVSQPPCRTVRSQWSVGA